MIEHKLTIDDIDLYEKKVLVRNDFNVPIKNGVITDDERIIRALPTIKKIRDDGGIAILCSHLGRPKGERKDEYSLKPVADALSEYLAQEVLFLDDCIGQEVETAVENAQPGDIILLENLRFHAGESKNDPAFAAMLSTFADIYVNDAFGTAHRAHASNVGVAQLVETSVAGYLMMEEMSMFGKILKDPKRPFISIIGGLKISSKTSVIDNLMPNVNKLLMGGGLIFTFYKALGLDIGKSFVEEEFLHRAAELIELSEEEAIESETGAGKIVLPMDIIVADDIENPTVIENVNNDDIEDNMIGLDIGKHTAEAYAEIIENAGTVVVTGPMGVFENPKFAKGTKMILDAMVTLTEKGGVTVVGGGDTVSAVKKLIDPAQLTHVSTGGGASLKVMEGSTLPAIEALTDK